MKSNMNFSEWYGNNLLLEGGTRYSIEVNFRTGHKEVADHFIRLSLGYVMAAVKRFGYNVKHVYTNNPAKIIIASRGWEDGSWAGIVSFDKSSSKFNFSEGFYNKFRDTCSVTSTVALKGDSAADVAGEVLEKMEELKKKPPRKTDDEVKRGPKK